MIRFRAVLIGLFGLSLLLPGAYLVVLGGSFYYVFVGVILLGSAAMFWKNSVRGSHLYAAALGLALLWTWYESGLSFWGTLPRLSIIGFIGLLLLIPLFRRKFEEEITLKDQLPLTLVVLAGLVFTTIAYVSHVDSLTADKQIPVVSQIEEIPDWPAYGNSRRGTRYSTVADINRQNVSDLEIAWHYRSGIGGTFKVTPIVIDDTLYACAAGNIVLALDADSGEEKWRYDPDVSDEITSAFSYFTTTCRGVSYYEAPADYEGECPTRLLMGTVDARLLAVDARTGKKCAAFGDDGEIDLRYKMGEVKPFYYFVTSAPAIVRGNAVLGGWVMDNREINEPSGVVRAFDAITGEFAWAWDMGRPGDPGEPGDGEVYTRATPNVWSIFSVDEERGLVFAPLGNETPDYFGGQRLEVSEEFSSAVVAIDGNTGELVWSFQTVNHDIWDYDAPSQPVLADIPDAEGNVVPAVIQATKRGEVFLLNRETGEPLAEVSQRPVPQGGVPEEWTAETQPYSALPNVVGMDLTEHDMWGVTPWDHLACRIGFNQLEYRGHFTPPNTHPVLQYPGNAGGYNWGSVTVDESRHLMLGTVTNAGNVLQLVPRSEVDENDRFVSPQFGTPYGSSTERFASALQLPCNEPPFGMLAAIDLRTHELAWNRPVGTASSFTGIDIEIGMPGAGGAISTAGDLIFLSASFDGYFRALDVETGRELWRYKLPGTAQATPMSYRAPQSGTQYVVITVPDGSFWRYDPSIDTEGGHIIAFRVKGQN